MGLLGEYAVSSQEVQATVGKNKPQAKFENSAWQVALFYVLTGEDASFDGVSPGHPFSIHGTGWGAWEIVARAGQLSFDHGLFRHIPGADTGNTWAGTGSAREGNEWGVGLNWNLNKNVKLNVDYNRTQFEGGSNANGAVTAHDEQVVLTRAQIAF